MGIELIEALPGMELGKGFNKLTGDVKVSPAVRGKKGPTPGAVGQKGGYSFTIVRGREEFNEVLEVGASISAGLGAFRASAKAKFAESCQVSSMSTVCVLSFHAVNAYESFHGEVELEPDAEELLRLRNRRRFLERFGTDFISGEMDGVEFYGTIKIESETTERDEEIAVAINASYGLFSASGKVDKSTSESLSREKIEILTWQRGGTVEPVFTLEELFERARMVAKQAASGGATPISVTLDGYDELKLPTDDISSIEEAHAREVIRQLEKHYHSLLECQHDIEYVLRHQDYFKNVPVKALNDASKQIARDLETIVERADACSRDFSKCELFAPTFPNMEKLIPERRKKSVKPRKARAEKQRKAEKLQRDAKRLEDLARHVPNENRRKRLLKEARELKRRAKALLTTKETRTGRKPTPAGSRSKRTGGARTNATRKKEAREHAGDTPR